jgi:O-acetyl-ADP-ribose deacetylase
VAKQGRLPAGNAVITTGGNLPAKYVIHTVGPIWRGGAYQEAELLSSAYRESLKVAAAHRLKSISFPSISTGAYAYPLDEAAAIAVKSVTGFLQEKSSVNEVVFVLFDSRTFQAYQKALSAFFI